MSTKLAECQDRIINRILTEDPLDIQDIKNSEDYQFIFKDTWVKTAEKLSPSNLVIRNLCIIDLISDGAVDYTKRIETCYNKLTLDGFWLEGYSYWKYTYPILMFWAGHKKNKGLLVAVDRISMNFLRSGYVRDGYIYPAPFGDLRDEYIRESNNYHCFKSFDCKVMKMTKVNGLKVYNIYKNPVGLNTHTVSKDYKVTISKDGIPGGFHFYEGYDKKYKNKFEEFKDIFSFGRIISLFKKK